MENTMQVATPQVDTEIAETLQWIRQTMESGTDFLTDQAPMYAEELLRYGAFVNWLWFGVGLLMIAFLFACWTMLITAAKKEWIKDDDAIVFVVRSTLDMHNRRCHIWD